MILSPKGLFQLPSAPPNFLDDSGFFSAKKMEKHGCSFSKLCSKIFLFLEKPIYSVADLNIECNQNCSCNPHEFKPLCGEDNVMYFSSCYAGCKQKQLNRLIPSNFKVSASGAKTDLLANTCIPYSLQWKRKKEFENQLTSQQKSG